MVSYCRVRGSEVPAFVATEASAKAAVFSLKSSQKKKGKD